MATKRPCHFQDSWIVEFELDGISRSPVGDTFVRCNLCKTDFSVMNSGRSHVTAHLRTACHTRNRLNITSPEDVHKYLLQETKSGTDQSGDGLSADATNPVQPVTTDIIETIDDIVASSSIDRSDGESFGNQSGFVLQPGDTGSYVISRSRRRKTTNVKRAMSTRNGGNITEELQTIRGAQLELINLQVQKTRLEIEKLKSESSLITIQLENATMKRALLRDQLSKLGYQVQFGSDPIGNS